METTTDTATRNPYYRPDLTPYERVREYHRLRTAGVPVPLTDFAAGDRVRAVVSEQGLEKGVVYDVTSHEFTSKGVMHKVMKIVPQGACTRFLLINNGYAVLEHA